MFIALQDLRPLYAGRCEYHSSETASDREVRNTYLTFHFCSETCITCLTRQYRDMLKRWRIRGEIKSEETVKSFLTCRCPVRQHRAHPVTCVWRATPVTAATSTTAGSEYTERSSTWQNSESVAYSLCLVALICLMCTALPFIYFFRSATALTVLQQECLFNFNLCFREHPLMGLQNKDVLKKFRKSSMIWK